MIARNKPKGTLDLDAEEAVNATTDAAAAVTTGAVKATAGAALVSGQGHQEAAAQDRDERR